MKTNYEVTIHFQALLSVQIKANSEEEAKEKARNLVASKGIYAKNVSVQDNELKVAGALNMDDSWNKFNR
jgi:hypothetical protein